MSIESTPALRKWSSAALVSTLLPVVFAVVGCEAGRATGADEGTTASAESSASGTESPAVTDALVRALNEQLTVWRRPDGERIHIAHCRRAEGGCRARIEALAELLVEAARENGVDPFLLAAMAVRESGLRPESVGIRGSGGILQLNPRGVGHDVRVVRDERYRRQCRRKPAACQEPVIELGAEHLAEWIERCDNLRQALGGYNTGECQINKYPGKVLSMREKLREYAQWETVASNQPG